MIHGFTGAPEGSYPLSELFAASDGYLYGTTSGGGTASRGTIFRISLDGTLNTLHSFMGNPDGGEPRWGIIEGADGNFYGMTSYGGTTNTPTGPGTFFRMTSDGTVTAVDSPVGQFANSRLVQGIDGNFYGTTSFEGLEARGRIYRVTPSGVFTTMAAFSGQSGLPTGGSLLQASDTHLYGTLFEVCIDFVDPDCLDTHYFRMDLDGHVEFLKRFEKGRVLGTGYLNPLIEARDGNLYGTWAGEADLGSVVRISNYTDCNDKLTVRYEEGTLHLGFTLMTRTPATFQTWLAVPGPPVRVAPIWSVPIPALEPALFTNVPVPGFPHIGRLFVLTALTTESGAVCADWRVVDTGATMAAPAE